MSRKKNEKPQPQDPWTLSIIGKDGHWQKFNSDPVLRKKMRGVLDTYEEEVAYINNPKNNMSPKNIDFARNVFLDHMEMVIKHHLESLIK